MLIQFNPKKWTRLFIVSLACCALAGQGRAAELLNKPASMYSAQTFARSDSFVSLEEWARANYTEYLVEGSLKDTSAGEYQALSFVTREGVASHFNLVMDTGSALVLLTTAGRVATDLEYPLGSGRALRDLDKATCDTATNRCNCVLYARCLVPRLPFGLFTYSDKVAIINSYSPSVGYVAIMNVGPPYGHVGVVTKVVKDSRGAVTSITLTEANYHSCMVGTRSGSPSSLKVTGYFRP